MPIATLQIVAGRSARQKREMIRAVANAIAATLAAPMDTIKVIVHEVSPEHWGSGTETMAERQARRRADAGAQE